MMPSTSHTSSLRERLALISCTALLACGGPRSLPPERAEYAGQWQGPDVSLKIGPDAQLVYDRREGKGNVHVEGPIMGWTERGFVVGVMTMKTDFEVNEAPHQLGGTWHMTLNGDALTRVVP